MISVLASTLLATGISSTSPKPVDPPQQTSTKTFLEALDNRIKNWCEEREEESERACAEACATRDAAVADKGSLCGINETCICE